MLRRPCSLYGLAVCAVMALCSVAPADYQDDLYFPFVPGNAWVFLKTEEKTERWGTDVQQSGAEGLIHKVRIDSTDEVIYGHQATHVLLNGNEQPPDDAAYYALTDDGIIQYSDDNPNNNEWYECYDNGYLFLPNSGKDGDVFPDSTPWHGQWRVPEEHGGGYEAWSGNVSGTITILGMEGVMVPAGTFNALKIQLTESNNKRVNDRPEHNCVETCTTFLWLAKGVGPVRLEEWWHSETEYLDTEQDEYGLMELVAFKRGGEPDLPGQTVITCQASGYASSGDPDSQQAVADAMTAVADSMQTFQGGMKSEDVDSYGCLAGVLTMDADAVEEAMAAMAAEGATPSEQFIRIEFAYDESELADLGLTEADLAPYWWNADRNVWVVGGTTTAGGVGAGTPATLPEHEGLVGYYGVDAGNNIVWANVNHASMYSVGNVPEPATPTLLALGGIAALCRRRRQRRAA